MVEYFEYATSNGFWTFIGVWILTASIAGGIGAGIGAATRR
jgi:hypothetical protein